MKMRSSMEAAMAAALLLVMVASTGGGVAEAAREESVLKYYVHILVDGSGYGSNPNFLPKLNETLTADFGEGVLFALNATEELDPASKAVGFSRGYTIETSYIAGASKALETVVIEYANDAVGVNGTFLVSGLVGDSGANELAIIGGTGDFRGASGYLLISFGQSLLNNTFFSFAHEAHFYYPRF